MTNEQTTIDRLRAELRTANAEIARLMPLPEIYTLWKKIIEDGNPSRDTVAHFVELAHKAAERAAAAPADLRTPTDQRIAALEAQMGALKEKLKDRTQELIRWIETGNWEDGTSLRQADARIKELQKELDE